MGREWGKMVGKRKVGRKAWGEDGGEGRKTGKKEWGKRTWGKGMGKEKIMGWKKRWRTKKNFKLRPKFEADKKKNRRERSWWG